MTTTPTPSETPSIEHRFNFANQFEKTELVVPLEVARRHVAALESRIADLTKRLETAEEDTKRLDWLEKSCGHVIGFVDPVDPAGKWSAGDGLGASHDAGTIRAAIDAAISAALTTKEKPNETTL